MAKYIDATGLIDLENSNSDDTSSSYPIPEGAIPGDIINYGEERCYKAYFLGWNDALIKNPEAENSGNLVIPLEVTKHFPNAVKWYDSVMKDDEYAIFPTIVLGRSDQWVVRKYGRRLPKGWTVHYTPEREDDDCINIDFGDGNSGKFHLFDSYEKIKGYYEGLSEPQMSYKLRVEVKGARGNNKRWDMYKNSRDLVLPFSWKCDGGLNMSGSGVATYKYELSGAEKDRNAAIAAVEKYCDVSLREGGNMTYVLKRK